MLNCREAVNDKQERTEKDAVADYFMAVPPTFTWKY
jgi:hypothetical protein